MARYDVTQEELKKLVHYDPDTGVFTRLVRTSNRIKVGDVVGCSEPRHGYLVGHIKGDLYLMHRLAWMYVHGRFPENLIDHKNGIVWDNRISNLREASRGGNSQNLIKHKDNSSGYLGVYWSKAANKYVARICVKGKGYHLGCFVCPKEAYAAYRSAKENKHLFNPVPRQNDDA